mmetsp:Transcript_13296/g.22159  ORF Transcript_13296/g.22159 Transcript_13296/m.22159 type:complete len:301 (-) Transcript_13296:758-1660(-)
MPTSFAPSPMARVTGCSGAALIMRTSAAFCSGLTRQAMTVGISCTASTNRIFTCSFDQMPSKETPSTISASSSFGVPSFSESRGIKSCSIGEVTLPLKPVPETTEPEGEAAPLPVWLLPLLFRKPKSDVTEAVEKEPPLAALAAALAATSSRCLRLNTYVCREDTRSRSASSDRFTMRSSSCRRRSIRWHFLPMAKAVSALSPVIIHTFTPAECSMEIDSGTPSCSSSSIPTAPSMVMPCSMCFAAAVSISARLLMELAAASYSFNHSCASSSGTILIAETSVRRPTLAKSVICWLHSCV